MPPGRAIPVIFNTKLKELVYENDRMTALIITQENLKMLVFSEECPSVTFEKVHFC